MFLGTYRFEGDPAKLKQGYDKMVALMPHDGLSLHLCVIDEGGLWVYDTCPSRDAFLAFSGGADLRNAFKAAGLPEPRVTPVGEVHAVFAEGKEMQLG